MSFVRNLFFSVFLGVWGTLSAQEERVIPVPREVLPGTGEFRISEVTAWHTNLSGAEKESLVNYAAAELSTGRQEWQRSYGQGCRIFSKNIRCGHSSRRVCFGSQTGNSDGIGLYRNWFVLRFAVIAAIDEAG